MAANDGYEPIDADSAAIVSRRTCWMRLCVTVAVAAAVVLAVSVARRGRGVVSLGIPTDPDVAFAGLLMDDKGFYFPTTLAKEANNAGGGAGRRRRHRKLQAAAAATVETLTESYAQNKVDVWGLDWSSAPESAQLNYAAIGEYYKAKGMALADYYRSKYDPTYQSSKGTAWTYDWQADQQRGVEIGKYYQKIGLAIDDHYHELYDPTYRAAAKGTTDGGPPGRRRLRRRVLKATTAMAVADEKEEEAMLQQQQQQQQAKDDVYNWQADRDRGMAIGEYYKQLGDAIAAHYNQTTPYKDEVGNDVDFEWTSFWDEYRQKGHQIGQYYKEKSQQIKDFYKGKIPDVSIVPAKDAATPPGASATGLPATTSGHPPPPAGPVAGPYDWQADKAKGLAIADYYRARYDPTYADGPAAAAAAATAAAAPATATATAASNPTSHGPPPPPSGARGGPPTGPDVSGIADCEQTFPPWGQDKEADKAHGQAIGSCWKQKGRAIGEYYKQHGKELGTYYEDYYRSMFDPTYNAAATGGAARV